jgi:Tfp pilus assembly protein PilW
MKPTSQYPEWQDETGFSLAEFLISALILLVISGSIFMMLAQTQRAASYQTEIQAVLENMRIALNTLERVFRQAGSNPTSAAFAGVNSMTSQGVRILADLTGAGGTGDPDGATTGPDEDITVSYDSTSRSIRLASGNGTPQPIANYISNFQLQYFDDTGAATTLNTAVRKIRVTVTGASALADPQTNQRYSLQIASDVELPNR